MNRVGYHSIDYTTTTPNAIILPLTPRSAGKGAQVTWTKQDAWRDRPKNQGGYNGEPQFPPAHAHATLNSACQWCNLTPREGEVFNGRPATLQRPRHALGACPGECGTPRTLRLAERQLAPGLPAVASHRTVCPSAGGESRRLIGSTCPADPDTGGQPSDASPRLLTW